MNEFLRFSIFILFSTKVDSLDSIVRSLGIQVRPLVPAIESPNAGYDNNLIGGNLSLVSYNNLNQEIVQHSR